MDYSIKHLELKINWYRNLLESIPHGYFGIIKGKKTVYITYDPNDKQISARNKRRLNIDSKQGRIYAPLISEYLRYEGELKSLMSVWDSTFIHKPRQFCFPLNKSRTHFMNSEFFLNAKSNTADFNVKNPIDYENMTLRSKNELIAYVALKKMGFEAKVEPEIILDDFTVFNPDIIFNVPEADKCIAVEIDGAMDKETYMNKSENRKLKYISHGFKEYKDVIFLRLYNFSEFDISTFECMVRTAVDSNIEDIIFPSSTQPMSMVAAPILLQNHANSR